MQTENTLVDAIDTGTQIFNIKAELTRKGLFFTSYCQLVTVRSKHLEIERVLDLFIDMTLMACVLDSEGNEDTADAVEAHIRKFVNRATEEL
jgi:hypothetical protein